MIFGEHNEHGYLGAPIAKHVIETYFAKKEGLPLPSLVQPVPVPTPPPAPEPDPDLTPIDEQTPIAAAGRARALHQGRTDAVFERRLYHHVDWGLLVAVLTLCAIGLAQIYSATGGWTGIVQTQIYGIAIGIVALLVTAQHRLPFAGRQVAPDLRRRSWVCSFTCCSSAPCAAARAAGSTLASFNLQPSEFAKAALALVLAKFFGESRRGVVTRVDLLVAAGAHRHSAAV